MYVEQGWKMFVCWRNLKRYPCVLFRYDGEETLWLKIFYPWEIRVGCCAEDSSSDEGDSYDDEGTAKNSTAAMGGDGGDR